MADFSSIEYTKHESGVARIVLNRPETRNAQDKKMLYELNSAFDMAGQDDEVKVIVLAANGPHFSSGHDLRDRSAMEDFDQVTNWGGFGKPGAFHDQGCESGVGPEDHTHGGGRGARPSQTRAVRPMGSTGGALTS